MPRARQPLLLLLLLPGCALFELAAIKASFPPLEGELTAEGLDASITIVRDDLAVPHVRATTEHDAWFGQGFVHGQDRFWQADLNRHLAWGRVGEWLGEGAADLDGFMQSMQLRARAETLLAAQSDEARAMFEAYADGMNAGVESLPTTSIEYRLLGTEPEPWEAVDAYAVLFLMSWNLTENPLHETAAWLFRDKLDAATLSDLYSFHPDVPDVDAWWDELRSVQAGPFTDGFNAFTSSLGGGPDAAEASNNWVVGPSRSASGSPILANDPHLGQRVPSLWHASHVSAPGLDAAGVTLPGVPGFPIGHTQGAAWGLTNVMADVVDFAVLERRGEDGYLLDGKVETFTSFTATLEVGGDAPVTRTNLATLVGPVVTEAGGTHVLAMRWHAPTVEDRLPEILLGLVHSQRVDDLISAMDRPAIIAQNVAMADADGSFGYQSMGTVPKRVGMTGRTPYPASDGDHGWDGWLVALPGERDTERGYVHTANTRPMSKFTANGGGPLDVDAITTSWVPPHRDTRIRELLEVPGAFTADDVRRQQLDLLDTTARRELPWLFDDITPVGGSEVCLIALRNWDFRWKEDSAGAAVWSRVHRHLSAFIALQWLDIEEMKVFLSTVGTGRGLMDARLHDLIADREAAARAALKGACDDMRRAQGDNPDTWSWGRMHPLALKHPIASGQSILGYWNMPVVPFKGSGATVAAASYDYKLTDDGKAPVTGMASVRFVIDMADPASATITYPGGQAGHPAHPDYETHFQAFVEGDALPLRWDAADVDAHTEHTLTLAP